MKAFIITPEHIKKVSDNGDDSLKLFKLLIYIIWCRSILGDYLWAVLLRIPIVNYAPDIFFYGIIIIVVLLASFYLTRSLQWRDYCFYFIIATGFFLYWSINTNTSQILGDLAFNFLCLCLPLYFVGLNFRFGEIQKNLYILSVISIIALFFYKIVLNSGYMGEYNISEDMFAAYNMLPHLLLVLMMTFEKHNVFRIVFSIFGVLVLFSFGTRGPLICCILFIVLYLFIFKKWKHPWRARFFLIGTGVLFLIFLNPLLIALQSFTMQFGMSTRISTKLLEGSFLNSWGRDDIQNLIFPAILKKPWFGYGLAGDRLILNDYSHNFLLELWVSFGIPIGSVVFLSVIACIMKGFFYADHYDKGIILLLVCCSFIKLMVSGTFLTEKYLFLLIGICVTVIRHKRIVKNP